MHAEKYNEIKKNVPNVVNFKKEIVLIENFFYENDIDIIKVPIVFWNHIVTLFERVDSEEQNNMNLDDAESMSEKANELTNNFVSCLNKSRNFKITEFENYLLTIYFEQFLKGVY